MGLQNAAVTLVESTTFTKVSKIAQTANDTVVIPAGMQIISVVIRETAGHAITGGLNIGTTNGGNEIASNATVVHTYTSAGTFTETAPANATTCAIDCDGGGGGGAHASDNLGGGGAGSARAHKNAFVVAAGDATPYVVGAGAAQKTTVGDGNDGIASSVNVGATATGGFATALATALVGGQGYGGTVTTGGIASTATGGDVNTSGIAGTTGASGHGGNSAAGAIGGVNDNNAGAQPTVGAAPGAGGGAGNENTPSNGKRGGTGQVIFTYATSSGATVVNANSLLSSLVPGQIILSKYAFSATVDTTLYIQAVTAWNSASINITFQLAQFD